MPFIRIPGLINAFVVENVRQLRELERHEHVSPVLSQEGGLLHRVLASRVGRDLLCAEKELPRVLHGSVAALRGFEPDTLSITGGELYKMASYVAGSDRGDDLEVTVQRWVARRFNPHYESSPSVGAAARLLGRWHRRGPLSAFACLARGRLDDARALLSSSVACDLQAAYAPILLLPYIVMCLDRMRVLAQDPLVGERLSAELVVAGCLAAPRLAFRSCTKPVEVSFSRRPLPAHTLLILPTRRLRATGDGSSGFGGDDSSRYPALRLIRRLLTQVWTASRDVYHPAARSAVGVGLARTLPVQHRPITPEPTLIFELSRLSDATPRLSGATTRLAQASLPLPEAGPPGAARRGPRRTRRRRALRAVQPVEPGAPL
jgi:hypothetical protein